MYIYMYQVLMDYLLETLNVDPTKFLEWTNQQHSIMHFAVIILKSQTLWKPWIHIAENNE